MESVKLCALRLADGTILDNTEFNNSNKNFSFAVSKDENKIRNFLYDEEYKIKLSSGETFSIYIADSFISYKMSSALCKQYNGIDYFLENPHTTDIHALTLMTKERWMKAPDSLLQKINFTYNGKLAYFLTSSVSSSGKYIWLTYDKTKKQWLTSELGSDTEDICQEGYGYLPVFLSCAYYGTYAYRQIGLDMVLYDNDPNESNNKIITQYWSTSDMCKSVPQSCYKNIIENKKNITFVYNENARFRVCEVFINNEAHYISRVPIFLDVDNDNIEDLVNKLKNFTINGATYEIKLLSINQWEIMDGRMYDDTYDTIDFIHERDDSGEPESLWFTCAATSSFGHIKNDVILNYGRGYFSAGWFKKKDLTFTSSLNYDNTDYDYYRSGFYPVIKRCNPNKDKNIEKFGTLQITRNGISKIHAQPPDSDCTTCAIAEDDTFTFVSTQDEKLKWKWIKTSINNTTIYISPVFLNANINKYTIVSNMKNITIDGIPYKMRLLSMDEWKSLDLEIVKQIDFGLCINGYQRIQGETDEQFGLKSIAGYRAMTSTISKPSHYEWFGGYDEVFFNMYITGDTSETANTYLYPERSRWGYLPVLELLDQPPTISEQDKQLEDKTKPFVVYYFVDDPDKNDNLTITEKLNGIAYRTITNAVRKNQYSFEINSSMFSNLKLYNMNTIEITVSDGTLSTTRTYTFRKTNTAPTINYSGSVNLGTITSKPTIDYSIYDAEGDEITVTERLNGKTIRTFTAASDTSCTVQISDDAWLSCGSDISTVEITVRDDVGGSNSKTITFNRSIDRIEAITKPIETTSAVTKISLEIDWDTTNASGKVFVCNNGFDDTPTWEDMTTSIGLNNAYTLTNNTKVADKWGISVKVTIKKDEGATNEVSLYSIKGTYQ